MPRMVHRRPLWGDHVLVLLALFCAGLTCVSAVLKQATALTDSSFEIKTQSYDPSPTGDWFVLFHMPWCGYCKEMIPIWDRLSDELDGELGVGKVDLEMNTKLMHRFRRQVKGFPTMILFHEGMQYTYTGTRDINDLKGFARGGWQNAPKDSRSAVPIPPERMTWLQALLAALEDFVEGVVDGYGHIWSDHKTELLCAISTSFSLGGIFGFLIKIFIDAMLPPSPQAFSASDAARPRNFSFTDAASEPRNPACQWHTAAGSPRLAGRSRMPTGSGSESE